MSLAIDPNYVDAVLLADGWHEVSCNSKGISSFDTDAYEIIQQWENPPGNRKSHILYSGGTGFTFTDALGRTFMGPISSILAMRKDTAARDGGPDRL